eukprot:3860132-Rhodomonas_salina.1
MSRCAECGEGSECTARLCTTCSPCQPGFYKPFVGTAACQVTRRAAFKPLQTVPGRRGLQLRCGALCRRVRETLSTRWRGPSARRSARSVLRTAPRAALQVAGASSSASAPKSTT